jgi:uncharacterized phage protein gp47/JayE
MATVNLAKNPIPGSPVPTYYSALVQPTSIDYTSKDWLGLVTSMMNYAQVVLPEWDVSSEGDFGVMLVELFAYMGDILSYYGDRLTQEAYLPTATQRLSILNLAQLLGYIPTNGAPATGTVTFQTNNPSPAITIPAGTQLTTGFIAVADAPILYETDQDYTVPQNGGTVTGNVTQGQTFTQQIVGVSSGTAGQSFQIPQANIEDGSVQVFVASSNGVQQWNQVTFLVDAGPDDLSYSLFVNENQLTSIQFGDNVNGVIPGSGLTIFATFTIGMGSQGNQPAGSVGIFVTPISGVSVPFVSAGSTAFQSSAMTGGSDPETNDQIRANAAQAYSVQQRAVSPQDFANLALNVPGALMTTAIANHSTSVTLFVLGPNYQAADTGLQDNIVSYFQGKMLAGVSLTVGAPTLVSVDVGTNVTGITLQVQPNFNQGVVTQNVTTALQALLSPPNTQFGMLLQVSSIYSAIMAVQGVEYAIVPSFTREDVTQSNTNAIQFRQSEIPVSGNIFISPSGGIVT